MESSPEQFREDAEYIVKNSNQNHPRISNALATEATNFFIHNATRVAKGEVKHCDGRANHEAIANEYGGGLNRRERDADYLNYVQDAKVALRLNKEEKTNDN
jgi:hypothetical protein